MQVCFHPFGEEPLFTAQWVEAKWNSRFSTAAHSDLLGSLMALGMERAFLGDIIVEEGRALVCVMPELAARLPVEWTSAGRTPIWVSVLGSPPEIAPPEGKQLRDTVPSLRLDCVVASGMKQSRTKAA
ncbi:MAG: YlmH/Sll1252 family protein [Clostridia bacterium]|nr:YlmH/Sll1252 family protein [Clostridia bacterium]